MYLFKPPFFWKLVCDKKTFVDSKDWEVDTTITEISNITEISIDDDEEDGELLLKEDTQGKNISKSDKEIVSKEQEQLGSSNINDKMKKSWKCRDMFSGYRSKDHMSIYSIYLNIFNDAICRLYQFIHNFIFS